jgi:hypothetical protein
VSTFVFICSINKTLNLHNYDTMDQIMKILHIEKKGPKLNTLERYHIYEMTKRGLQMNDTFMDMHNPIFDVLIKTHK